MIYKEKARYINNYTLASQLMMGTVAIGCINIFLHGAQDLADTSLALIILVFRYLSFILIKRRFSWSIYLLWLLLARSIYRFFYIAFAHPAGNLYLSMLLLQLILTSASLYFLYTTKKFRF